MPTKKTEVAVPQTDLNPELDEMLHDGATEKPVDNPDIPQTDSAKESEADGVETTPDGNAQNPEPLQTGTEISSDAPPSPEDAIKLQDAETVSQTDSENTDNESPSGTPAADTSTDAQTEVKKTRSTRRKKDPEHESPETEPEKNEAAADGEPANETAQPARRRRTRSGASLPVVSIDDERTVETEADKLRNDLLDLVESQKTGRILTGTIQGIERPADNQARSLAVIYHGGFKVIIPAEETVEPPDDYRGMLPEDVMHYMLTKRLGAEVDYIVKGIDVKSNIAAASRLDAMRAKRKAYYFGSDRDGNNLIYSGICAEARVVSVIRAGIFIDLFGLEVYIPLRELSYQRWMDASAHFQPGQRILVKVLEVDRTDRNHIKVTASVKQAGENPYEKALRRYSVGNRYVGTVSMVDTNGVFVALDGGIDCLCSYPKRGRPPRGARVTVRILGINHESNRIWGAITHIATAR